MITSTEIFVSKEDIDQLGHVNNSVYVNYLERGREQWYIEAAGMSTNDMSTKNIGTVVLRIDVLFKKETVYGDKLTIKTIPVNAGNTSFVLRQEIYNQKEEMITEATITSVMFDLVSRKSIPIHENIYRNFQ